MTFYPLKNTFDYIKSFYKFFSTILYRDFVPAPNEVVDL